MPLTPSTVVTMPTLATSPVRLPVKPAAVPLALPARLPVNAPLVVPGRVMPAEGKESTTPPTEALTAIWLRVPASEVTSGVQLVALPPVSTPGGKEPAAHAPGRLASALAVLALPASAAVTTPAVKLPEESRRTMAVAVLMLVAAFASCSAACRLAAVDPPTVAIVGLGYVPPRSPPAAPTGEPLPACPVMEMFQ